MKFNKLFLIAIALLMVVYMSGMADARNTAMTDTGHLGNQQWSITSDGDLIPNANTYTIGTTSYYPAEICMGGVCKTSWGSIISPMTDATGYTYPTDSGAVVRLYDAGYVALGAGTAVDTYILFDTDDDDWYMGRDDTDNDFAIGVGSTLGTDERISIVDNAALTAITFGDGADSEDKYVIWDGNATDQYMGYLDTYDMVAFGDGSTMDADMAFGIENASTPLLVVWNGIDGYGAIDIDYGSADITDHTFVSDGGTLVLDGVITLTSLDIISNATDDTIRLASEDADSVVEIYSAFTTNGDATLQLTADADADAGDRMAIVHDGATNSMFFQSDTDSDNTLATILTLAKTGAITTTAAINADIDDASNTTVTDVINIVHSTSGTAAAGIGAGLTFDLENAVGTEEEHAYIDVVSTTATDGAEDSDVVIGVMSAGAVAETLRLVANSSATTSDYMQFTANTTETTVTHPVLVLATATGTAANGHGAAISFRPEDATGSEEHARIDVTQTTAARTTNDTDFIFTQDVAGTLEERVRFDADDDTILVTGTLPKVTIGDGGDEDAILTWDGQTNDFYAGFDTTDDLFNIGVGSTPGTTAAIEINASANVIIPVGITMPYQIHAAADTLTINEGSKLHVFDNAAEYKLTLPAASTAAGIHYHVVCNLAPSTTSYTIGTNAGEDLIYGLATVNGAVIGAQAQDLITFTLDAAVVGDWVDLYCDGVKWYVSGQAFAATGIAFSAT